jgi:hypothetical protein
MAGININPAAGGSTRWTGKQVMLVVGKYVL